MKKERRYLKIKFEGYLPADLAIECHLHMRNAKKNEVGGTIKPYEEYEGSYQLKNKYLDCK